MTKLKVAKRTTAPNVGAATSTANPTAMPSSPPVTTAIGTGLRVVAGQNTETHDAARVPSSCVISLFDNDHRLHTCAHCGGNNEVINWVGTLSDSIAVSEGDYSDIGTFDSDDSSGDRTWMVQRIHSLALKHGYTHSEVREYSGDGDYLPLYGGPIPTMNGGYVPMNGGAILALNPAT